MKELTHFIGGWHVPGESGRFGDVFNPATGEVQAKVPFASRTSWTSRSKRPSAHSRNGRD